MSVKKVKREVLILGLAATLLAIIGAVLLMRATYMIATPAYSVGLQTLSGLWIAVGAGFFMGTFIFERGHYRAGANMLWMGGALGIIVGAGFFVAGVLAIAAGYIGLHAHLKEKRARGRAHGRKALAHAWADHHYKRKRSR